MGNSFTVVQYQRQHFGNQPGSFNDIDGVLYLNTFDRKLCVYANGAWLLHSW